MHVTHPLVLLLYGENNPILAKFELVILKTTTTE